MPVRSIDTFGVCNPYEWSGRIDKNVVGIQLKKAIRDLWDRMREHTTDREAMVIGALVRHSPQRYAWYDMDVIVRMFITCFKDYETNEWLEKMHVGLAKLYAFVVVEVTKAHMAGDPTHGFFYYEPMIEVCMQLCRDAMVMRTVRYIENYDLDMENNNPSCNFGEDENPRVWEP